MISCEKAAIICNKSQYKEASFIEKLSLRYHLLVCKSCSTFTKKNTDFSMLCDKANLQSLSEYDKLKMKEQLKSKR